MAVQTIQQTGKVIKAFILLFALVAVVGGASIAYAVTQGIDQHGQAFTFGLVAFVLGSLGFFGSRVAAWWFHG
jgi:hypothetical protein